MIEKEISVRDAIIDFKTYFDFGNRDNTRRAYFRSIDLFALFLLRGKNFHNKTASQNLSP